MFLLLTACSGSNKVNTSESTEQVEPEEPSTLEAPVNGVNTFVHDDLEREFDSTFHPIPKCTIGDRDAWLYELCADH